MILDVQYYSLHMRSILILDIPWVSLHLRLQKKKLYFYKENKGNTESSRKTFLTQNGIPTSNIECRMLV